MLGTRCAETLSGPKTSREPRDPQAAKKLEMAAQRCPKQEEKGKRKSKEKWTKEKREEIAQLSDAQVDDNADPN